MQTSALMTDELFGGLLLAGTFLLGIGAGWLGCRLGHAERDPHGSRPAAPTASPAHEDRTRSPRRGGPW